MGALNALELKDSEPEEKNIYVFINVNNGMVVDVSNPLHDPPYPIESEIIFKYYPNMPITNRDMNVNFKIRGNCIQTSFKIR